MSNPKITASISHAQATAVPHIGAVSLEEATVGSLAELAAEWQQLENVASPSPFLSWVWLGTWLETLPKEVVPSLLRARCGGHTIGLALLTRRVGWRHGLIRSRTVYLNVSGIPSWDCITLECNGFLAPAARQDELLVRLIEHFAEDKRQGDELMLGGITVSPEAPALRDRRLMMQRTIVPRYYLDLTHLAAAGGDPGAALSRNARQQIRRAIRQIERRGPLHVEEAGSVEQALAYFAELKMLHTASWQRRGRTHAFTNPYFERFHTELIRRGFAAGGVQLLRIAAGQEPIGFLYNLRRDRHVYAYQSGFADAEAKSHPGYVSHYLAIRHCYEQGDRVYDFLAGRNRLKETFSSASEPMYWDRIQRNLLRFRLEETTRRLRAGWRRISAPRPADADAEGRGP